MQAELTTITESVDVEAAIGLLYPAALVLRRDLDTWCGQLDAIVRLSSRIHFVTVLPAGRDISERLLRAQSCNAARRTAVMWLNANQRLLVGVASYRFDVVYSLGEDTLTLVPDAF